MFNEELIDNASLSWWKLIFPKLFGERNCKVEYLDGGKQRVIVTSYYYKDKFYITDIEHVDG